MNQPTSASSPVFSYPRSIGRSYNLQKATRISSNIHRYCRDDKSDGSGEHDTPPQRHRHRNQECRLRARIRHQWKQSKERRERCQQESVGNGAPAKRTASINFMPFLTWRLIKSTITRLSFTTTPNAIMPSNESMDTDEVGLLPLPKTSSKRKIHNQMT